MPGPRLRPPAHSPLWRAGALVLSSLGSGSRVWSRCSSRFSHFMARNEGWGGNFGNHLKASRVFTLANNNKWLFLKISISIRRKFTELGSPHPPAAKPRVSEQREQRGRRGTQRSGLQRPGGGRMAALGDPTPWLLAPRPGAGQGGTRDGTAAPGRLPGGARFLDNRPRAQPFLWAGGGERAQGPPTRAGTAAARGAPPGLSGRGPHPGARTYRVSPLQVTLLVAKGRDVDLHGCAWRRADKEQGRLTAHGRRSAPVRRPASLPCARGTRGCAEWTQGRRDPAAARSGRAGAAPGDGERRRGGPGLRAPELQA